MWIILGVFLSFAAMALEPFETIKNVKILRVFPRNIVMMNRGLEDGISRNDHIKISNQSNGFASRAICLKVKSETSYWQIYRIPQSKAFSMDYTYLIMGLADREIPFPVAEYRYQEQIIEGLEEEKPGVEVAEDLPKDLSDEEDKRVAKLHERQVRAQLAANESSAGTSISLRNQSKSYRSQRRSFYEEKALARQAEAKRFSVDTDDEDLLTSFSRKKDELFKQKDEFLNSVNSYKKKYYEEPTKMLRSLESQKNNLLSQPRDLMRNLEYQKDNFMSKPQDFMRNLKNQRENLVDKPQRFLRDLESQRDNLIKQPNEALRSFEYQKNRTLRDFDQQKKSLKENLGFDF